MMRRRVLMATVNGCHKSAGMTLFNLLHNVIQGMHGHCGSDILGLLTETTGSCTICIAIQAMQEHVFVLTDNFESR